MEPVGVEREVRAQRKDLLHFVVRPGGPAREAAAESGQVADGDSQTDLLFRLAGRLGERLAGAQMPAHGDVEGARPGVLRLRAPLEQGERPSAFFDPPDPDMECSVPVTVAMDFASGLEDAGGHAILVEHGEELVLRIGGGTCGAQNRSRTLSSAPSATSCSVSSLRPGRTSRRTTPSPASRYWPTQSSRGE